MNARVASCRLIAGFTIMCLAASAAHGQSNLPSAADPKPAAEGAQGRPRAVMVSLHGKQSDRAGKRSSASPIPGQPAKDKPEARPFYPPGSQR